MQLLAGVLVLLLASSASAQPYRADPTTGGPTTPGRSTHDCNMAGNPVVNCGFETGDFTGWVATDMADPFFPLLVAAGGLSPGFGLFTSAPAEGTLAMVNGFDGAGPDVIVVAQDVTLPAGAMMEFDYRAGWDMMNFGGSTHDRVFSVEVEPAGGGPAMQTDVILVAQAGTIQLDTGPASATVDLSAFGGHHVRVSFEWFIPETFTGPAFFQLDNVQIMAAAPALPAEALATLAVVLALAASVLLRRRRNPA